MIEIAQMRPDPSRSYQGQWEFERRDIASEWMDSSHSRWFDSLFDEFRTAMDGENYVGAEAQTAYECIRLIEAAYASAADRSCEVVIDRLDALPIVADGIPDARVAGRDVAQVNEGGEVATVEWT